MLAIINTKSKHTIIWMIAGFFGRNTVHAIFFCKGSGKRTIITANNRTAYYGISLRFDDKQGDLIVTESADKRTQQFFQQIDRGRSVG